LRPPDSSPNLKFQFDSASFLAGVLFFWIDFWPFDFLPGPIGEFDIIFAKLLQSRGVTFSRKFRSIFLFLRPPGSGVGFASH
jgi:hypothetical protein